MKTPSPYKMKPYYFKLAIITMIADKALGEGDYKYDSGAVFKYDADTVHLEGKEHFSGNVHPFLRHTRAGTMSVFRTILWFRLEVDLMIVPFIIFQLPPLLQRTAAIFRRPCARRVRLKKV